MNEKNDGKWRCPVCKVEAVVEGRNIHVYIVGHTWPKHWDCELSKDIDSINFDNLERIA
ncbi:hypothetical protein ES703_88755 [subsurface metagenome]